MSVTFILSICNQFALFITSTPIVCHINKKKRHDNVSKALNPFLTISQKTEVRLLTYRTSALGVI